MRLTIFSACFCCLLLITNTAIAGSEIVAMVNGKPLTAFELDEKFQDILPLSGSFHGGVSGEKIAEIRNTALNNLIDEELQYQYALENKITVSNKEVNSEYSSMEKRFDSSREFKKALKNMGVSDIELKEFIKKRLLAAKAKKQVVTDKSTFSDQELSDYYEKNKNSFFRPEEFRASHILLGVDPTKIKEESEKKLQTAREVLSKIKAGEDFASLAMKYSTDQASAPMGGDLGTFHKGTADEAFEKAMLSLKVGEVSDVVETYYGYHIIMLTGHKPAAQLTFDDVKADLKNRLEKKKSIELYNKWIEGLRTAAKIEVIKK